MECPKCNKEIDKNLFPMVQATSQCPHCGTLFGQNLRDKFEDERCLHVMFTPNFLEFLQSAHTIAKKLHLSVTEVITCYNTWITYHPGSGLKEMMDKVGKKLNEGDEWKQ